MPSPSDAAASLHPTTAAWLSLGLAMLVASIGFRRVRGTTLVAPVAWTVAAALACMAVEMTLAWNPAAEGTLAGSVSRYAAAVGSLCPLMAVLGAKRPQNHGWQWVVASLWVVLLAPAGQSWVAGAGDKLVLSAAWRMMIGCLIGLGLLNYLPTRHAISAVLVASGQVMLFWNHMTDATREPHAADRSGALVLFILAALMCEFRSDPARGSDDSQSLPAQFNARWLAYRNGWGAFWGLRILNRINESANLAGWPVRLEWNGFAMYDGAEPHAVDQRVLGQISQTMSSLLRRFERLDERVLPARPEGRAADESATPPAENRRDTSG